jgi:hypothetical protein
MQYVLLICSDEQAEAAGGAAEEEAMLAEYGKVAGEMAAAGVMVDGHRLQPTSTATTVSIVDGKVITTDGPFAETKEQIGGFFLIECPDLDAALGWAAKLPTARYGRIEVRPVWQ